MQHPDTQTSPRVVREKDCYFLGVTCSILKEDNMSKSFKAFVAKYAATLPLATARALRHPDAAKALTSVGAWRKFVRIHSGYCSSATAKRVIRLWLGKPITATQVTLAANNARSAHAWKQATCLKKVAKNWSLIQAPTRVHCLVTYVTEAKKHLSHLVACTARVLKAMAKASWITAFELGREILSAKFKRLNNEQHIWQVKIAKANAAIDRLEKEAN